MISKTKSNIETLNGSYEATFSYHQTLVQIRFNVLGLFIAGSSFLAAVFFADPVWHGAKIFVGLLGFTIAILMWLLELRTYCMLRGLVELGCRIEKSLNVPPENAFFHLMSLGAQETPLVLPTLRIELHNWLHKIVRHSVGLELTYFSFGIFWIYCLAHLFCSC